MTDVTEEKKEEIREAVYVYLDTLGEEKNIRIEKFAKRRKVSFLLITIVSGLMAIAAGVLTGITCALEALQGRKEQIVIAAITIAIGLVLALCTVFSALLLKKYMDKNRTDEDKLFDYVDSNSEKLYQEATKGANG